jgi:hypothetical protein
MNSRDSAKSRKRLKSFCKGKKSLWIADGLDSLCCSLSLNGNSEEAAKEKKVSKDTLETLDQGLSLLKVRAHCPCTD